MIFSFFAVLVLLALRLGGKGPILGLIASPYDEIILHTIGVTLWGAVFVFLDRLIRRFYWEGYLRRRRKQDTPALIEDIVTAALVVTGISIGLVFDAEMS